MCRIPMTAARFNQWVRDCSQWIVHEYYKDESGRWQTHYKSPSGLIIGRAIFKDGEVEFNVDERYAGGEGGHPHHLRRSA